MFSDKVWSRKSTTIVPYPVYVTLLNVSMKVQLWLIEKKSLRFFGFLVAIERSEESDAPGVDY